jgi:MFS family permease
MTATTAVPSAQAVRTKPGGLDRRALAILMPIGPLAIAIVRGILPYYTRDSNTVMAAKVAAHQGAETAVIWLTFVAMLTLVPGVIALGMLARRHAPRLGTTGLVLACAGFLSLFCPRWPAPTTSCPPGLACCSPPRRSCTSCSRSSCPSTRSTASPGA